MFQIRKISDLTRLCVLPVMILSIFLAFYLYVDMDKIQNKSQELVNSVIPHVLTTQQSAINLVELRSNIELVATSPDLQRARQSYVAIRNLINNSELKNREYGYDYQENINEILFEVNRLWKLRLQLDELRTTLHSSLHFMDTVMYLVYNEHPELFPEIDRHISNYIDIYKTTAFSRDLRTEHQFYYQMMVERLSPSFDRKEFLQSHPYEGVSEPFTPITKHGDDLADNNPYHQDLDPQTEAESDQAKSLAVLSSTLDSIKQNDSAGDTVLAELGAEEQQEAQAQINEIIAANQNATTHESAMAYESTAANESTKVNESTAASENIAAPEGSAAKAQESAATNTPDIIDDERALINQAIAQLMEPSTMADMKMLAIYKQELDRFDPLWDLYLNMQQVFASDLQTLLGKVYDLSHSFTTGEASSLHAEIQYISFLASETQPMVMAVLLFCLIGFSVTIFVLNRYVMRPLKSIAHILTRFRQTQNVTATEYHKFMQQQHLMEIREIVDLLPQIFADYSQFKEKSNKLQSRYEELKVSSKYDDLTKVFNRGSLNMLIKSVGSNTPASFACLMIDIDYFKNLNDTMGHQHGDEVLFAVAQILQRSVARKDLVFRYGGEEFCIFLSDINEQNAYSVAERLCNKVKSLQLKNEGTPSSYVTISVGLSLITTMRGQFRIEELIAQADKALYLAKRTGRDRVVSCPAKMLFAASEGEAEDILDEAIGEAIKEREGVANSVDAVKRAEGQADTDKNAESNIVRENIASTESSNPAAATVFVRKVEPKSAATKDGQTQSGDTELETCSEQALSGQVKGRVKAHKFKRSRKESKLLCEGSPFSAVTTESFGFADTDDTNKNAVLGTTMGLNTANSEQPEQKPEPTAELNSKAESGTEPELDAAAEQQQAPASESDNAQTHTSEAPSAASQAERKAQD